jgi:hypothetical protein
MCIYVRFSGAAACAALLLPLLLLLLYAVHRWRNPRCNGRLPPGSMGLPLVGETLQFFAPDASLDAPRFVRHRLARYEMVQLNSVPTLACRFGPRPVSFRARARLLICTMSQSDFFFVTAVDLGTAPSSRPAWWATRSSSPRTRSSTT